MISRRALFGLSVGAAATAALPAQPKPTVAFADEFVRLSRPQVEFREGYIINLSERLPYKPLFDALDEVLK